MADTMSDADAAASLLDLFDGIHDREAARAPQKMYAAISGTSPLVRHDEASVVARSSAAVQQVLRNAEIFRSGGAFEMQTERPIIPLMIDPPDHRKYRKLLDPLFAPKKMAALEEPIVELVNDLIDGFDGASEIDFAKQFSVPFPTQVFLTLFGLPVEEAPKFLRWKDGIMHPDEIVGKPKGHPDVFEEMKNSAMNVYLYFAGLLDQDDNKGLIAQLLEMEVEGDRLTKEEVLDISFTLFNAGLDTVSSSLECFFAYLGANPDQRRRIVDDPAIIPKAVEELLRFETPVMGIVRKAVEDTKIEGCPVKAGDRVSVMLGSANADEDVFEDACAVRLDRDANRHFAFGAGIHRCLGSHLARLELRVALREWHRRIPEYSLVDGVDLHYAPTVRTIFELPLVLGPVSPR